MKRWIFAIILTFLINTAADAMFYDVVDLGVPQGTSEVIPRDLNDSGIIVGHYSLNNGSSRAFYYDGTIDDLGTLGGNTSAAYGINNDGIIVGTSRLADGSSHAYYYDGTMHDIGVGVARSINNNGYITGTSSYLSDGTIHEVGGTLGEIQRSGEAINNSGVIVGNSDTTGSAFFYDGTMHDLGTLAGEYSNYYNFSYGRDINDSGIVVGDSNNDEGKRHAFLYDGTMHDLGALEGDFSIAYGINNEGIVVGLTEDMDDKRSAFIYDGIMKNLNDYILDTSGWTLTEAFKINNIGQIVGIGFVGGEQRGFLLNPVTESSNVIPEPATMLLFGAGLAGAFLRKRR